jgi:protein O-GlcNAc transferase
MTPLQLQQTLQQATRLHQQGQLPAAEQLYRQILAQAPNNPDGLRLLGLLLLQTGRLGDAVSLLERSIKIAPNVASTHNTFGEALRALNRVSESEAAYRTALRLNPKMPEAWNNLANALQQQGRSVEAEDTYRKAIAVRPDYFRAYSNLGNLYLSRSELQLAEQNLRKSLAINANFPPTHAALGEALSRQGKSAEGLASYQNAIRLNPNDPDILDGYGRALRHVGRLPEAIAAYRAAVQLNPGDPRLHVNLGEALQHGGQVAAAVESFQRAIELNPEFPEPHNNLASSLAALGQHEDSIAHLRTALRLNPNYKDAHGNLLFHLHYLPYDRREVFEEHKRWAGRHATREAVVSAAPSVRDARVAPTRVAYVSPDLWRHPVAAFLEPLLEHHDRSRFEVFIYSDTITKDDVTVRLQSHVDHWRDTRPLTDDALVAQIRSDGIDVLIDLTGHTASNRLGVFAHKAALVQVTYLGYPDTTGLTQMDYRITDAYADPPGQEATDSFHTEKLLRLPHCFLCYSPPNDSPPIQPRPPRPITFGSFNRIAKLSPATLELWAQILRLLPDSRLVVKSTYLADEATRNKVREYFLSHQIADAQLDIHPPVQSFAHHLDFYNQIDIALDPFPYNGTTTTCEALWMGVPVITLEGSTHVARVGVSLLSNANLPELIAATPDAYIELAVELAKDADRLSSYRHTLRERLFASPLLDASRFTAGFEDAILKHLGRDHADGW